MSLRLAYIGVESPHLAQWQELGDVIGFQSVPADDALFLRMDEMEKRFIVFDGPANDFAFSGFEASGRDEFDRIIGRLRSRDIVVEAGTDEGAALRSVERYAGFRDPAGVRHEIALRCALADTPFVPPFDSAGFVTGDEGIGHVTIPADDPAACEEFASILGAGVTDRIAATFGTAEAKVSFLHLNNRHHSLAYARIPWAGKSIIDHVMIETTALVDVLKTQTRVVDAGIPVTCSLGEHPNDHSITFFCATPSAFSLEIGAQGIKVEPESWTTKHYDTVNVWGHKFGQHG